MEPPFIPGMDVAGIVDSFRSGVEDLYRGQEVVATIDNAWQVGVYSEYVIVSMDFVTAAPRNATSAGPHPS